MTYLALVDAFVRFGKKRDAETFSRFLFADSVALASGRRLSAALYWAWPAATYH